MQQISPKQLKNLLDSNAPLQLIDVREQEEHAQFNIGGVLFPLPEIMEHLQEIRTDIQVVFYCKMGVRSMIAIQRLEQRLRLSNLYNLTGGMEAWKKEIGQF